MNTLFSKRASIGMLAIAMMFTTIAVSAQDNKRVKKQKQEEIIIKKKGDTDEKVTIVIDGDAVTINGKPVTELNGDIAVTIDRDFSFDAPHAGTRSFSRIPRVPAPPAPPMPPYFSHGDALNVDGAGINLKFEPKAMLGVYTEKDDKGAKVTGMVDDSPAAKAGMRKGDIITKVNEKAVAGPASLSEIIGTMKPGDKVDITYIRDKNEKKITLQLGERKDTLNRSFNFNVPQFKEDFFRNYRFDGPEFGNRPHLGIKIQDVEEGNGVKVIDMEDASPAAISGIRKDDIITAIDGTDIKNTDDAREKMADLKDKSTYMVKLLRNGVVVNVEVRVPKKLKTTDL